MATESIYEYKGYFIKLRSAPFKGFGFKIYKIKENILSPNGIKKIFLREKTYNFTTSEKLLFEAKNYIDNHENNLIKKYNKLCL